MNAVLTLIRPFVGILAHRDGPENLPASQFLLGLVIAVNVLVYMLGLSLLDAGSARLFGMPLIDTVAQAAFFVVLLSVMGFQARVLQTLTAAFGADALLSGILVLVALARHAGPPEFLAPVLWLAAIAVILWSLGVKGHILQRAAGLPYFVGVIIALAFLIAMLALERALFEV